MLLQSKSSVLSDRHSNLKTKSVSMKSSPVLETNLIPNGLKILSMNQVLELSFSCFTQTCHSVFLFRSLIWSTTLQSAITLHLIHILILRQEILEVQYDPVALEFVKWLNRKKIQQTYFKSKELQKPRKNHFWSSAANWEVPKKDSMVGGWECLPEIPEMSLC
jgi:hypothetical protein